MNRCDFLNDNGSVVDKEEHLHETHAAGTLGEVGGHGLGVPGVDWNVNFISAKIVNSSSEASLSSAIKAIDYITDLRTK